jgi:predicted XRE-type DNA-binding protein
MSRNPFLDLGFPPEEAAALHIRSQLAAALEYHIERKGWSQTEAARALKVPQPTVSKIVNGNIEKLSIEFLIAFDSLAVWFMAVGVPKSANLGAATENCVL